jgi:hypothetical protein
MQRLSAQTSVSAMVISAYTNDKTVQEAAVAGAEFMGMPLAFLRLSRWVGEAFVDRGPHSPCRR